jgi:hypothetical protein
LIIELTVLCLLFVLVGSVEGVHDIRLGEKG